MEKQTKYIKVKVSDRLPSKEGIYPVIFNLGGETIIETVNYERELGFYADNTDCHIIDEWLDEIPDREDELTKLLREFYPLLMERHLYESGQKIQKILNDIYLTNQR